MTVAGVVLGGVPMGFVKRLGPECGRLLVKGVPLRSMACRTSTRRPARQIRAALCSSPRSVEASVIRGGYAADAPEVRPGVS